MYALQLAHLAGYKVVTVASPKNHALCRSLGANFGFDVRRTFPIQHRFLMRYVCYQYKDPAAVSQIREVTRDSLHYALDAISSEESQVLTLSAFGPGPGKLVVIVPLAEKAMQLRPDVHKQGMPFHYCEPSLSQTLTRVCCATVTLLYTALGRECTMRGMFFAASPEDHAHMAQFLTKTPELVTTGKVKPNPIKLWEGGLKAIPDGLRYMKEGRNSGEKIVYRVA